MAEKKLTITETMDKLVHLPRKLGFCGACTQFLLDVTRQDLRGECRARAPFVNPIPPHETVYPEVYAQDIGCGSFKRVEE